MATDPQSTKPEEPHWHSKLKCGDIRIEDKRLSKYGNPWLIRRAFCVKHQVVICWAKSECGWEIGQHFEDDSMQHSDLVKSEAVKKGIAKKKSFD